MSTIFVGGSERSGTTVLTSILCGGSTTNPLLEDCSYIRKVVEAYAQGCDLFDEQTHAYFRSREDLRDFNATWLTTLLQGLSERYAPAEDLVLKEPLLTPFFPFLAELLPDARLILTVRDPRDTIASMVRVMETQTKIGQITDLTMRGRDMELLSRYYLSFYSPVMSSDSPTLADSTLILRHEDVLGAFDELLETLREFTGLPLQGVSAANPWARSSIDFSNSRTSVSPVDSSLHGQPLSAAHAGNFLDVLTPDEVHAIEHHCAEVIQLFGYQPSLLPV